jgi:hypothetical protein
MGGLGVSDAIAALMGMYVVLYVLRCIPFFYMVAVLFQHRALASHRRAAGMDAVRTSVMHQKFIEPL